MRRREAFVVVVPAIQHRSSFSPTTRNTLGDPPRQLYGSILDGEVQEQIAETTVQMIAVLGGGVLVFAAILTFINMILVYCNAFSQKSVFKQFMAFDRAIGSGTATITRVRLQLAQLLALGLQILLCGDIVETLVKSTKEYSFESLYKLALVSAIRTGLSYFLGLETEEILDRAKVDRRMDGIAIRLVEDEDDDEDLET